MKRVKIQTQNSGFETHALSAYLILDSSHECIYYSFLVGELLLELVRKVGGGFRMGNICTPMLIHVSVWQKPLQYCEVISLQLK